MFGAKHIISFNPIYLDECTIVGFNGFWIEFLTPLNYKISLVLSLRKLYLAFLH